MKRHHRDRELRDLLVDEPVARRLCAELPVPRRAYRHPIEFGHHPSVTWASPAFVVAGDDRFGEDLGDRLPGPVRVPTSGLVDHLLQELDVVFGRRTDVHV